MSIPKNGTVVRARQANWDAVQENNAEEYPDPALPTLEGESEYVTGPLTVLPVKTRWGNYTHYVVNDREVDPATITPT